MSHCIQLYIMSINKYITKNQCLKKKKKKKKSSVNLASLKTTTFKGNKWVLWALVLSIGIWLGLQNSGTCPKSFRTFTSFCDFWKLPENLRYFRKVSGKTPPLCNPIFDWITRTARLYQWHYIPINTNNFAWIVWLKWLCWHLSKGILFSVEWKYYNYSFSFAH